MAKKRKVNMVELKASFNDITMRELGLDIDENDHIYDIETESLYVIKDKFLRYTDEEYPVFNHNEIDMNLIENPRLMEHLFGMWIPRWAKRNGNVEITSFYQSALRGSNRGLFVLTFINNKGETEEIKSDAYINESVRIFNLIAKLNHRQKLYKLDYFDIEIVKGDKK